MELLTWNHFRRENNLLRKKLGVDEGKIFDLYFSNGFFIAPDSYKNRSEPISKILLKRKVVDVFRGSFPKISAVIKELFEVTEGFDPLNWDKFTYGLKLGYFFAATSYLYEKKLRPELITFLYRRKHVRQIHYRFEYYIKQFLNLFEKFHEDRKKNLYVLFKFAIDLIHYVSPKTKFPKDFRNLKSFLKIISDPFMSLYGHAFEDVMQEKFKQTGLDIQDYILACSTSKVGENGVLIPLDEDDGFKRSASFHAGGLRVPDFLFITESRIFPVDLKVTLHKNNYNQVSANNIRQLFSLCKRDLCVIFDKITIEGHLIESEKLKHKIKKSIDNPMQILSKECQLSKIDMTLIATLWREGRVVDQNILKSMGVKHGNLGMITSVFNNALSNKIRELS
ncbi:MAG: hypothetical protein KKB65_00840 [Nanoarchaeota archaeon]|nr:hypothetical protein [Nanoarchaeota archaeon]MBU1029755.1 hypothetical protein [Nanoarchaeota archaeon]